MDERRSLTYRKITLEDVRASMGGHVRAHYTVKWFGRPIGNLLTPMFHNSGWTANGVTGARTVLSFLAVALLCTGEFGGAVVAVALYTVVFILDCVDGNLARLGQSVTYWGKFIDGLSDMVFPFFAPIAVGVGIWTQAGDGIYVIVGAVCGMVSMASQLVRNRLSFMREWMVSQSGPLADDVSEKLIGIRSNQKWVAAVYVNASFFAPLLLLVPDWGAVLFVLFMTAAQLVPETVWLGMTMLEARILLARRRRSAHEPLIEKRDQSDGSRVVATET